MKEDIYNIFDKELYEVRLIVGRIFIFIEIVLHIVFIIISFYSSIINFFYLVLTPVTLLFLYAYYNFKRKYGIKIEIKNLKLNIYNSKGKFIRYLDLENIQQVKKVITILPGNRYSNPTKRFCMVLFKNIKECEIEEYQPHWNDPNVLIIQNPEAIAYIEDKLKSISNS